MISVLAAHVHDSQTAFPHLRYMPNLLLDRWPWDEFRYEHITYKTKCCGTSEWYYAECDGAVSFWVVDPNGEGMGGRIITLTKVNGEKVQLKGPWTSCSGSMNVHQPDSHHSMDVHYKVSDPKREVSCYCLGHVTLPVILDTLDKHLKDWSLFRINRTVFSGRSKIIEYFLWPRDAPMPEEEGAELCFPKGSASPLQIQKMNLESQTEGDLQ